MEANVIHFPTCQHKTLYGSKRYYFNILHVKIAQDIMAAWPNLEPTVVPCYR